MGFFNFFKEKADKGSLSLMNGFFIPEPTRSLLYLTNDDPDKAENPFAVTIKINIDFSSGAISSDDEKNDGNNIFAEPSLIWTKLPVEANNELEMKPMYFPSYSDLSPKQRYQYLLWLKDISQPTNLSYVFLYFYGLERQMLTSDYDLAVDEIIRLAQAHNKDSFTLYATDSLIAASVYRKRYDILERACIIFNEDSDLLFSSKFISKKITPKDVIANANDLGFKNKRYINNFSNLFEKELGKKIKFYEKTSGLIVGRFSQNDFPKIEINVFANASIPKEKRCVNFFNIFGNGKLRNIYSGLLQETHDEVKKIKKEERSKVPKKKSKKLA